MNAPIAAKIPHCLTQHNHTRVDDYFWLRDENWQQIIAGDVNFKNRAILDYLNAENAYKTEQMADYAEVKTALYHEMLSRIEENYTSYPVQRGNYFYYYQEKEGLDYPILCRKHLSLDAPEQVYMDVNQDAAPHALYMFGPSTITRDNSYLAYGYNTSGSMERTIKVRDLASGNDLPWSFPNSTGTILWLDNEHLLIVERDEFGRGQEVYRVNIHQGPEHKTRVFSKPPQCQEMFLELNETTDRSHLVIELDSGSTQHLYMSRRDTLDFQLFTEGRDDVVCTVDHHNGELYILTNQDGADNFQIFKTDAAQWAPEHWQLVQKESEQLSLTNIHFYNDYLIIEQTNNERALDEIEIVNLKTQSRTLVSMPDAAYELDFGGAWDYTSSVVRLAYSSPIRPGAILELDLATGKTTLLFTRPTPNFDADKYTVERLYVPARDGAAVPVTLVRQKAFVKDGSAPLYQYGYGSYGKGVGAGFSSVIFSLIDRGFVYAIAHVRGGDEKGYRWYLDGKMRKKQNTFNDFVDVAQYLADQGYTAPGRIAINGGSAGGLLMGAVTNMRPDLFGAVVADVAFVDVVTTISDDQLPLTPPEWEEWGNPIKSAEDYHCMLSYSPYDNVQAMDYPPMLFTSGISDEQVTYWEPTKMVAKLRALKTDDNLLLLDMNMNAGHAGATKRYEWVNEEAFSTAFILKCLGLR